MTGYGCYSGQFEKGVLPGDSKLGPSQYLAFGACVSHVRYDALLAEATVLRAEIVTDQGYSLNPSIDAGQAHSGGTQTALQPMLQTRNCISPPPLSRPFRGLPFPYLAMLHAAESNAPLSQSQSPSPHRNLSPAIGSYISHRTSLPSFVRRRWILHPPSTRHLPPTAFAAACSAEANQVASGIHASCWDACTGPRTSRPESRRKGRQLALADGCSYHLVSLFRLSKHVCLPKAFIQLAPASKVQLPSLHIGRTSLQVQGAFTMGLGYVLTEEFLFSEKGANASNGTWEYKPPSSQDIPVVFNISFLKARATMRARVKCTAACLDSWLRACSLRSGDPRAVSVQTELRDVPNAAGIYSSKAVGEPAMLASASILAALRHAVGALRKDGNVQGAFDLSVPATPEAICVAAAVNPATFSFAE
eukprot:5365493-Pleurochrysis_carterae.AAC.1